MRLLAMTRSPASSILAMILPVRLRRVASGLMIEKVRSSAMAYSLGCLGKRSRLVAKGRGRCKTRPLPPSWCRTAGPPEGQRRRHTQSSTLCHGERIGLDAIDARQPSLEIFLELGVVRDELVVVRHAQVRDLGDDVLRPGRLQGRQRDHPDMAVGTDPERLLQPSCRPARPAQDRDVEEHIVDAARKSWAPRLPIGHVVNVRHRRLRREPHVFGQAGMGVAIGVVFPLRDAAGGAATRIVGIVDIAAFAGEDELQAFLEVGCGHPVSFNHRDNGLSRTYRFMFCSSQYVVLRKRSMSAVTAGLPAAQSAGLDKAAAAAISPAMLTITDLTYRIEGRPLFEGASVVLPDGAKAGFVGKNGAGKTTLFRLILGQISLDAGS